MQIRKSDAIFIVGIGIAGLGIGGVYALIGPTNSAPTPAPKPTVTSHPVLKSRTFIPPPPPVKLYTPKPTPTTPPGVMASYTIKFPAAPYRTHNIGMAAKYMNGSTVEPGKVWSYNDTVGERTKARGFVEGTIIGEGGNYATSMGGGVSAVATTVFNAAFFAGVPIVEHGPHSFYIERYPVGRDATVVWGSLDMKFRNDTDSKITVKATATKASVTVTLVGHKEYDKILYKTGPKTKFVKPLVLDGPETKCVPQPPLDGFDISVDRIYIKNGTEVKRGAFHTHYVPRDHVVCPTPSPTPTGVKP